MLITIKTVNNNNNINTDNKLFFIVSCYAMSEIREKKKLSLFGFKNILKIFVISGGVGIPAVCTYICMYVGR